MGEKNPYRRLAYFAELPATLHRFALTGKEAWVDQLIDKALADPSADVVIAAIRVIGDMNKTQFTDKLISLYSAVGGNNLALSESALRCMVIRSLKRFPGPTVSSFLVSVVQAPPHQDQTSEIVREALSAMNELNDPLFINSLAAFVKTLENKKAQLQQESDDLPGPKNAAEEKIIVQKKSGYNRRIQGYAEMITFVDTIESSISSRQGGRK
jgi:hypothetical protein